ncbi:hypothetical protein [Anaeromyxobacter terrae]|uniref:hypothetical protein n=1 Tax=Anaeromyxobacter terrae TaxID=2925406 RepID=UPI001F59A699|nr:hypothetical protein [Anaeromyxobacter sp. SG22]
MLVRGKGTAVLDGVISPGEWDGAARLDFDAALPPADGGGTTPASLLVMSDAVNLYVAVLVARPSYGGATNPSLELDRDADGEIADGDDVIGAAVGLYQPVDFVDAYRWKCPGDPSGSATCGLADTALLEGFPEPGTVDGAAAAGSDGTEVVMELSHPLTSGDARDMALDRDDVVAFRFDLRLFALDPICNFGPTCYADRSVVFPPEEPGLVEIGDGPAEIAIDVKPGSAENPVQPGASGTLPVALLSNEAFDARSADAPTIRLGGAGIARLPDGSFQAALQDVDADGDLDVVAHFTLADLALASDATDIVLTGRTLAGVPFRGRDAIRLVP